ncbi:WW domain-binding protein 1-like isoform X2 [Protopterus annectens]|uniref:WW domain-binding protein 1-like isoform X2 n=1 Tax=Protopterus annectens TaxID=7888 RepID=UPI001CFAE6E0|nr:WW domain-binding protein 1-like isoform X2 [Protopterus annectens]
MAAEGAQCLGLLLLLCIGAGLAKGKDLCIKPNNQEYQCDTGYCCGEMGCCTNFHELWWFWLVWTVIVMLSCCCAYRHRQVKKRLQQEQRQREISLMACQGAANTFAPPSPLPPPPLDAISDCNAPVFLAVCGT